MVRPSKAKSPNLQLVEETLLRVCGLCGEATNPFNFEKLKDPPAFAPTLCDRCGQRIVLPRGGYTRSEGKRWCDRCDSAAPPKRRPGGRRT